MTDYIALSRPFIGPIRIDEYRCAECGAVYPYARDDDEARAESEAEWNMAVTDETHSIICDDCYQEFKRAFDAGEITTGPSGGEA